MEEIDRNLKLVTTDEIDDDMLKKLQSEEIFRLQERLRYMDY